MKVLPMHHGSVHSPHIRKTIQQVVDPTLKHPTPTHKKNTHILFSCPTSIYNQMPNNLHHITTTNGKESSHMLGSKNDVVNFFFKKNRIALDGQLYYISKQK
jgi:hypothetical protein